MSQPLSNVTKSFTLSSPKTVTSLTDDPKPKTSKNTSAKTDFVQSHSTDCQEILMDLSQLSMLTLNEDFASKIVFFFASVKVRLGTSNGIDDDDDDNFYFTRD